MMRDPNHDMSLRSQKPSERPPRCVLAPSDSPLVLSETGQTDTKDTAARPRDGHRNIRRPIHRRNHQLF